MIRETILVVDDEPQILRFLKPSLETVGYNVITAATGTDALRSTAQQAPDLVLLDLGLPDMDGKSVITQIRAWSKVPIVVVSARDREAEKIAALDLGADDYVNKPFGIGELLARIRAALRHAARQAGEHTTFTADSLSVDLIAHTATLGDKPLRLTPKEFDVLSLLVRNAGRVVTHRQILIAVWGPAHSEDIQYLRVCVGQLRQKLNSISDAQELIETEPGVGYRLKAFTN